MPRKKIPLLTAAGAGALNTYYLQGFGVPAFAPLFFRILNYLFPSETNPEELSVIRNTLAVCATFALFFTYAVLCSL